MTEGYSSAAYGELAGRLVGLYTSRRLPYEMTQCSTACNAMVLYLEDTKGQPYVVTAAATEPKALHQEIVGILAAGFHVKEAKQTCSIWQKMLGKARDALSKEGSTGNPNPAEIIDAVKHTGDALIHQLDSDPHAWSAENYMGKITAIGLDAEKPELFAKYKNLHPFYDASKHADRLDTRRNQQRLLSAEGWSIAMDYFETARRVFEWYYDRTPPKPAWPELVPIDCTDFPQNYTFDINRR